MTDYQLEAENTAEALLELLSLRGVPYFIAGGAGTDFPFIIEAYAKARAEGRQVPEPITAVHEITAVAMAHGYAMVSGQPLFVMLHTIVGLANGICGVINASRSRVPLFLAAGKTATAETDHPAARFHVVQWSQEAFDQAGMLREFVKWDFELSHPSQLEATIDRGLAISQAAPAGPVYLNLPVEVSGKKPGKLSVQGETRINIPAPAVPASTELRKAVELLATAENPLIITASMGRKPAAVNSLVQFAEKLAIPVVEYFHTHLNFPQDHSLHLGFKVEPYLKDADVILVIEHDAPWTPVTMSPAEDAKVIVLDEDPMYMSYPHRGFPMDLALCGDAALSLDAMLAELEGMEQTSDAIQARQEKISDIHQQQRQSWDKEARAQSVASPVNTKWLSHCIGELLNPDEDIVITEFVLDPEQLCLRRPASYFDHSHAGGLGWSAGAALGAKLAEPERTVICCVGDGTWTFGVPVATHHMSAMHNLPVLFIVFNNAAYERTRLGSRRVSKEGYVNDGNEVPFCELTPTPDYEKVCEAAGGYGEKVIDPNELPAALQRALKVVKEEGRQALLNVICAKS